ncbi:glutathione transferase [Colletotrichum plurivorum]|uniref:Glutathione transferase n=1 Tax=Colletotrichum plurivorum TaxID=2175906 RepID=A0A8H6K1E6_9PEZI|nr:glutathione transferase [Colletotrichum plurivorum]
MTGSETPFDLRPVSVTSPHGPHCFPQQQQQQQQQQPVLGHAPNPHHATPVTHFLHPGPGPGSSSVAGIEASGAVFQQTEHGEQNGLHQHIRQTQAQTRPTPDQHLFGILAPGPVVPGAGAVATDQSLVGPAGYIPIDGTTAPGWRPHGSLLSSKWVIDPPNLQEWRQKLFDADGLIILSNEQFEVYFPHVDNVYSHRSTQTYKKKPFISHYWDCRLKGRPPGTKKSDDPTKKRRNRISRKLNLCDVKIKITEYFPGATLHDLDDGTFAHLDGGQAPNGAPTILARPGEKQLRILPATRNNLPAPGQKFWTIQRVNGHISISGIPGPHKHTLEKSDEVKKNSVQRYLGKQKHQKSKNDDAMKATGRAHWTMKKHEKNSDLKLYAARYCPFSQRVWIALEAKGLAYQYLEEDPYKSSASQQLLEANPRGSVPAIRQGDWACADSAVILEYLEEMDKNVPLFPTDPQLRANCRLWIDHINSRVVPAFHHLLRNSDQSRQSQYVEKLQESIKDLVLAADEQGPFFLGGSLSLVDIHFAPFALRLSRILQPLCGWTAPAPGLRWANWLDALEDNVYIKATTSGKDVYVDNVSLLENALDLYGHIDP